MSQPLDFIVRMSQEECAALITATSRELKGLEDGYYRQSLLSVLRGLRIIQASFDKQ